MYKKKLTAECREYSSLTQDLLPGRVCNVSMQCRSKVCKAGKCVGRVIGQSCHQHSDCGDKQYCEKADAFPYLSTCQSLITAYQPCDEDAQCLHNLYCWYPSFSFSPDNYRLYNEKAPTRQCLPMYTQPKGK